MPSPCASCHGTGKVTGYACPGFRPVQMNCSDCNGEGAISDALAARKAKGKAMRDDRVARGLSLGEEAKRLHISPVLLSHWEHGIEA